ncbi:hypothetical protein Tco_1027696 [Tanacetum coccineum]
MTRSTIKKLTEPLEEPEREFRRRRKAAYHQEQNESLAIDGRNLFNDKASSFANSEPTPSSSSKRLREHSSPSSAGFQNPIILLAEQTGNIADPRDIWLIQGACTFQGLKSKNPIHHIMHYLSCLDSLPISNPASPPSWNTKWLLVKIFHDNISPEDRGKLDQFAHFCFSSLREEEGWNCIEEYVQYQDDLWDDPPPPVNVSSILEIIIPTLEGRLRKACNQISYLATPMQLESSRNPYLICDICGGTHEVDECDQNRLPEQVYLSRGDIYEDPSLLRFYQNDDIPPWGNIQC